MVHYLYYCSTKVVLKIHLWFIYSFFIHHHTEHSIPVNVSIFVAELNPFLTWKGVDQVFNNNELLLLKSIDLSSNHFSGEIPPEIANLIQLVSLNLSRNNFTGKIPSNIGKLTSLDFLDLSQNKLRG
ncbi:putative transferase [Medicago truncatula]|uniref:Putative transferase n=1 Tax=Medicago truncatula TaxID=3880 RepID=A0A396HIS8_MEDTR|nr:putative transferase [Medicago truncatula]